MAKAKAFLGWKAMVGVLALALVAVAGFAFMPANTASAAPQQQCTGDEKIEGSSAFFTAPDGKSISRVCIKAGTELYSFECGNGGDGCYKLNWIYDDCYYAIAVEVTGGGTSRT